MGGFGALYLAHRHQDFFGLSVPLSGYLDLSYYPEFQSEKITMEPELYIYCGTNDHICFARNESLVKLLTNEGVDFTYKTAPNKKVNNHETIYGLVVLNLKLLGGKITMFLALLPRVTLSIPRQIKLLLLLIISFNLEHMTLITTFTHPLCCCCKYLLYGRFRVAIT